MQRPDWLDPAGAKIHPRCASRMQSSRAAWGFIIDPKPPRWREATQNQPSGWSKGKAAGETRTQRPEASAEGPGIQGNLETRGRSALAAARKSRGNPEVPPKPRPEESDPGRPGDRADGKTGRRFGGVSRAESSAGAGRFTPWRKPQADHRRYRRDRRRDNPDTGRRQRREDARAGKPAHGIAQSRTCTAGGATRTTAQAARRQQASSGETRSRSATCGARETGPRGNPEPAPLAQPMDRRVRGNSYSRRRRGPAQQPAGKPAAAARTKPEDAVRAGRPVKTASAGLNGSTNDS